MKNTQWTMPDNYNEIFTEGLVIKNYIEFSSLCGWKPTTSSSKNSQFLTIDSCLDYKRMGQSFVITNVKETPDELEDGREGNGSSSVFVKEMEFVLYSILSETEAKTLTMGKVDWLLEMGAINHTFRQCKISKKSNIDIASRLKIEAIVVDDFLHKTSLNMWNIFEGVLTNLKNEKLIIFEDSLIYLKKPYGADEGWVEYENGVADAGDYETYVDIVKEHLKELEIRSEAELIGKHPEKVKMFYEEVNHRTRKMLGWEGFYKAVTVKYNCKRVKETIQALNIQDCKKSINNNVELKALENAQTRHERARKLVFNNDLDLESLGIMQYSEKHKKELDEKESFEKYRMNHYYVKDDYIAKNQTLVDVFVTDHYIEKSDTIH